MEALRLRASGLEGLGSLNLAGTLTFAIASGC